MTNHTATSTSFYAQYMLRLLISAALVFTPILVAAAVLPIGANASLTLNGSGQITKVQFANAPAYTPPAPVACATLQTSAGDIAPDSATLTSDSLRLTFPEGSAVQFALQPSGGFTLFRLTDLNLKTSATSLRLFRLPVPPSAKTDATLNAAFFQGDVMALMAGTPEIVVPGNDGRSQSLDLAGCSHTFTQSQDAKQGNHAAKFTATSTVTKPGWAMQGHPMTENPRIKEIIGLTAWVHGDGNEQQLKFQLIDNNGGARDYYLPINFSGWREVNLTTASLDITTGDSLAWLNLYYNSMPPNKTSTTYIDDIRAVIRNNDGAIHSVQLEDFENANSSWWTADQHLLQLEWDFRYTHPGDSIGVIICPHDRLFDAIQQFEKAANIIVPHPGGVWNKQSPAIHESYLFLTGFSADQFDEALALAKRGGFKHVLILQNSWCQSTGHYEINRQNFPDGLPGLIRTINRFRSNGISVGLHLLGASIDNNDPYLTPVPDPRLVKDAHTTLTIALDPHTTTITVAAMPKGFPGEDGGYNGDGAVLQIGDELIRYTSRTTTAPYTFTGCKRGHLGTVAAAHPLNTPVHHLARSYGYHLFDMDTSLLDEVTSNLAVVANACDIDMLYFDGSERLQGPHGRYNARLINAYISKLNNPNILVQASSFSHFSWHQLARSASADGHGDLKGYLDQRAANFDSFKLKGMPLDIGWYYGYDPTATPDMYEYILGTTIGYGESFSYQTSVKAAAAHPFTNQILDLVQRYETLRLSGRVTPQMQKLLRVAKPLLGRTPEDKNRPTDTRRDYHLVSENGHDYFQRIIYGDWHELERPNGTTQPVHLNWDLQLTTGPSTLGVEIHNFLADKKSTSAASLRNSQLKIGTHTFDFAGEIRPGQYLFLTPGNPPALHGPTAADYTTGTAVTPIINITPGQYPVQFTAESTSSESPLHLRVRTVLQTPERHQIPDKSKL